LVIFLSGPLRWIIARVVPGDGHLVLVDGCGNCTGRGIRWSVLAENLVKWILNTVKRPGRGVINTHPVREFVTTQAFVSDGDLRG